MNNKARDIYQICDDDPDVTLILNMFTEIERVYREALEAMGGIHTKEPEVRNTAEVTISLDPTSLTSAD